MDLKNPEISEEESESPISDKDLAFLLSESGLFEIELNGRKIGLEAFDTYRQAAASMMGCAFLKFNGEQIAEFSNSGTYNGMWRDVIIFGWLCTHDKKTALRAASNPFYHTEQAMEWAAENQIGLMSETAQRISEALGQTIVQIWTSAVEIDSTGAKGGGDGLGESLAESPKTSP